MCFKKIVPSGRNLLCAVPRICPDFGGEVPVAAQRPARRLARADEGGWRQAEAIALPHPEVDGKRAPLRGRALAGTGFPHSRSRWSLARPRRNIVPGNGANRNHRDVPFLPMYGRETERPYRRALTPQGRKRSDMAVGRLDGTILPSPISGCTVCGVMAQPVLSSPALPAVL